MGLMNLFGKSKSEENIKIEEEFDEENETESETTAVEEDECADSQETDEAVEAEEINEDETEKEGYIESEEESGKTLVSYHETLNSEKNTKKQKTHLNRESYVDQNVWRDVKSIEEKVDNLHISRAIKHRSDLDKKVDGIFKKNK